MAQHTGHETAIPVGHGTRWLRANKQVQRSGAVSASSEPRRFLGVGIAWPFDANNDVQAGFLRSTRSWPMRKAPSRNRPGSCFQSGFITDSPCETNNSATAQRYVACSTHRHACRRTPHSRRIMPCIKLRKAIEQDLPMEAEVQAALKGEPRLDR